MVQLCCLIFDAFLIYKRRNGNLHTCICRVFFLSWLNLAIGNWEKSCKDDNKKGKQQKEQISRARDISRLKTRGRRNREERRDHFKAGMEQSDWAPWIHILNFGGEKYVLHMIYLHHLSARSVSIRKITLKVHTPWTWPWLWLSSARHKKIQRRMSNWQIYGEKKKKICDTINTARFKENLPLRQLSGLCD